LVTLLRTQLPVLDGVVLVSDLPLDVMQVRCLVVAERAARDLELEAYGIKEVLDELSIW
jgi:hypothetical protein